MKPKIKKTNMKGFIPYFEIYKNKKTKKLLIHNSQKIDNCKLLGQLLTLMFAIWNDKIEILDTDMSR